MEIIITDFIIWRRVFYWELKTTRRFHTPLHPGPEWRIFRMSRFWVSYRSVTSRFPPFLLSDILSPYNKKNTTRWLEDTNSTLSRQTQHLTRSLPSLVRHCVCHSNIKFTSSRHRVISSIYMHHLKGVASEDPQWNLFVKMRTVTGF